MQSFFSDPVILILGIVVTLVLNSCFVAAEYSLIRTRFSPFDTQLRDRIEQSRRLQAIVSDGDGSIKVIRLGLSLSLMLYALFAFPLSNELIAGIWPESDFWSGPVSAAISLLLASALYLILGDALPRALGLVQPYEVLRFCSPIIVTFAVVARPFLALVDLLTSFIWRTLRRQPLPGIDALDIEAQIELVRKDTPEMSTVGQLIFRNTLSMRDLVVADVLLPRNQIRYFDLNQPLEDNLAMARESGHTRFPLCYGDLDRCVGLVHIKDIFRHKGDSARLDLRKIKRNIIRIDSEEPLESALTMLLAHRMHMALVIDEFHGTEGVLTLERILEQLVGDIRDEFDADEEVLVKADQDSDGLVVSGLTPLHEIEDLFPVSLHNEEVSTVGGLVSSELGRIPDVGEIVAVAGLEIEVTGVDETRVLYVRIKLADSKQELPTSLPSDQSQDSKSEN